jgi:hypothetical protein
LLWLRKKVLTVLTESCILRWQLEVIVISLKAQIIDMSKRPVKLKPAKCKLKVNRRKSFDLRSCIGGLVNSLLCNGGCDILYEKLKPFWTHPWITTKNKFICWEYTWFFDLFSLLGYASFLGFILFATMWIQQLIGISMLKESPCTEKNISTLWKKTTHNFIIQITKHVKIERQASLILCSAMVDATYFTRS